MAHLPLHIVCWVRNKIPVTYRRPKNKFPVNFHLHGLLYLNVTSITNNASGLKKNAPRSCLTYCIVYTLVKEEWPCVGDLDRFLFFVFCSLFKRWRPNFMVGVLVRVRRSLRWYVHVYVWLKTRSLSTRNHIGSNRISIYHISSNRNSIYHIGSNRYSIN